MNERTRQAARALINPGEKLTKETETKKLEPMKYFPQTEVIADAKFNRGLYQLISINNLLNFESPKEKK